MILSDGDVLLAGLLVAFICGVGGALTAHEKHFSPAAGYLAGVLLGPIGWLIVICMRSETDEPMVVVPPPPQWLPDPHDRHDHRYWDGTQWTEQVADSGQAGTDPLGPGSTVPRTSGRPPVVTKSPNAVALRPTNPGKPRGVIWPLTFLVAAVVVLAVLFTTLR